MGTTAEKLQEILNTKENIKISIKRKGGTITDNTPFSEYPSRIDSIKPNLQEKRITPTKENLEVVADYDYDGLSKVVVEAIDEDYIIPSGTLDITQNGIYDVTNLKNVNVITTVFDEWDGSYEEISSGYTLTLNVDSYIANGSYGDIFHYSLDDGSTWVSLNKEQIVLEGITEIKFNFEFSSGLVYIGTTNGGNDITTGFYGETEVFTLDSDTTWYITTAPYDDGQW